MAKGANTRKPDETQALSLRLKVGLAVFLGLLTGFVVAGLLAGYVLLVAGILFIILVYPGTWLLLGWWK